MGQKDVEREKPLFDGQSAEEFIKRWNAATTAIKNAAGKRKERKEVKTMPSSKSCLKSENGCFNKERMDLVKQLVADGNTNAEIADALDTSVKTVADMLYRWGIKRDKQRPCKMCGKPVNSSHPKTVYCEQCRKKAASECAKRSARKYSTKKTCEYCGKEFLGRATAKYCSTPCYQKAVASGKHKKPQNWLKRRSGKIDIEIRICGKVSERRENVDYYDAREIWHKGRLGQGYAAMREQEAYYKGWQDGKNYYLENFGGAER